MVKVVFSLAARAELIEAQEWYENETAGLGRQFRQAIDSAVVRVALNPLQFPIVYKKIRRSVVRRFPYSLLFVLEADSTFILACFHGSRNPKHWQGRT